MKVLIGCEYSGSVRDAFIARGHEAISCDLLPTDSPGPHYQGDVFNIIDYPFDFGGFHFPCTDASVSGARHFAAKKMDGRYYTSASLWLRGWKASRHIKAGYFEHPVSVMSSEFRKPDQVIQPWMFGHFETKAICLWLWGEIDKLKPTYKTIEECREALGLPSSEMPHARVHRMPPGPDRWKERSKSFSGVSSAMSGQWG